MAISDGWLSKFLFESDNYNAPFYQEEVFKNIALANAFLMFESANFIDKGNSHKSHFHKASKSTCKPVKFI